MHTVLHLIRKVVSKKLGWELSDMSFKHRFLDSEAI